MAVTSPAQPEPNGVFPSPDPSDPHRFERVRLVLAEVMETPAGERAGRLDELAGSDPPLHAAVAELLALAEAADRAGFLDGGSEEGGGPARQERETLPEWIGPYRVLGKLGEGGTGVVYLGESPAPMRRRAAVKLARSSVRGHAASRADTEAGALASFNHPGIAQVFETGVLDDGRRWTACELVEGEWISTGGAARGWRASVELLAQAAEAVHHAHQRGVVHRDLKPSNLLVERDAATGAGTGRIKVIDFGVARLLGPRSGAGAATEPGLLVGTLAYMSPEQLGSGVVDARTDVYGLGLVACEVLTGTPVPGRSGGLSELMGATQRCVCPRLSGCGGHERDLEAIIAKATEPEPGARYPSMQHLADDLRRVLARQPVMARRPGAWWRLRLYAGRHPWLVAAGAAAGVVIAGLLGALAVSRARLAEEVRDQRLLVSELVNDTLLGLRDVRGTSEQREAMIAALFERHERRLSEHPDDPDLLSLHARLMRERGDIAASVGRFDEAFADLSASREIYRGLYSEGFRDPDIGRLYAESLVRVGDVVLERDRAAGVPETIRLYRGAMAVQEDLARSSPGDLGLLDDLCWSYDRIGGMGDRWGVMPEAETEAWLRKRIMLSESLLERDPRRPHSQFNLAMGHLRLARFLALLNRDEESAAEVASGLPHIWAAVRAEPDRTMFVQVLVGMLSWEVRAMVTTGRHGEVPSAVERMVDTARTQVRLEPGDIAAEGVFISVLGQAARTMAEIGLREEARAYAAEGLRRIGAFGDTISPARRPELDEEEATLRDLAGVRTEAEGGS